MGSPQKLDMLNAFPELVSLTCQWANQQLNSPPVLSVCGAEQLEGSLGDWCVQSPAMGKKLVHYTVPKTISCKSKGEDVSQAACTLIWPSLCSTPLVPHGAWGSMGRPLGSGISALVVSLVRPACGLWGQIRLHGRHNREMIIPSLILNAASYLKVLNCVFCNKSFQV